jgi:subtilisin family serine protease
MDRATSALSQRTDTPVRRTTVQASPPDIHRLPTDMEVNRMKRFSALLLLVAVAACESSFEPEALDPANPAQPEIASFNQGAGRRPRLHSRPVHRHAARAARTRRPWPPSSAWPPAMSTGHALNGFAGSISEAARQGLMRDRRVLRIEQDQIMHLRDHPEQRDLGARPDGPADLPLNTTYTYDATAPGSRAYIVDSGIRYSHNQFGGRAPSRGST